MPTSGISAAIVNFRWAMSWSGTNTLGGAFESFQSAHADYTVTRHRRSCFLRPNVVHAEMSRISDRALWGLNVAHVEHYDDGLTWCAKRGGIGLCRYANYTPWRFASVPPTFSIQQSKELQCLRNCMHHRSGKLQGKYCHFVFIITIGTQHIRAPLINSESFDLTKFRDYFLHDLAYVQVVLHPTERARWSSEIPLAPLRVLRNSV